MTPRSTIWCSNQLSYASEECLSLSAVTGDGASKHDLTANIPTIALKDKEIEWLALPC